MPFSTPDYQAIRDAILRDILNQRPDAAVGADSDYGVRAAATGAAVEGLYQHQQWIVRQIFPDTADSDMLERHASLRRLTRKAATVASGTISITGTAGTAIPAGTAAKAADGALYATTADAVVGGGGSVSIAAQALVAGASGNQTAATALTLTAPPSGIQSAATVESMTGGTDPETDAALLARLLFILRFPPQGGSAADYFSWAMDVAGVTSAWVYPLRRGDGTADVLIGTSGGSPSAELVAATQTAINALRPVGADAQVYAPAEVAVGVTGELTLYGVTLAAAVVAINAVLIAYFDTLAPGDTVYLKRIESLISGIDGVVDFTLSAPATNVATLVDATHIERPVLGIVTLTETP